MEDKCLRHKKYITSDRITDPKILAEMIGDLHYEFLFKVLKQLHLKLRNDGLNDKNDDRPKLGEALLKAADGCFMLYQNIGRAWVISESYMKQEPDPSSLEAIEFADWIRTSEWTVNNMEQWFSYKDSDDRKTTEQLYQIFKNQKDENS